MSSIYKKCECSKFDDVTLTEILGSVFNFALNCYQKAPLFIPVGHFNRKEKTMIFEQLASAANNVICEVAC